MFILKTLNPDTSFFSSTGQGVIQEDPVLAIKEVIISNSNIDFIISFVLSFLLLLTSPFNDSTFKYDNAINFYLVSKININLIMLYFTLVYLSLIMAYQSQNFKGNSSFIADTTTSDTIPLIQKENTYYNKLLSFPKPKIIEKYWHTANSILHCIKNILFLQSFALSMIFWVIYEGQKPIMTKGKYYFFHIILIEINEFYCLFRFCFFLVKVLFNFVLLPMYFASIYLGYVEDKFNYELNILVNTQEYNARTSSLRKSQEEYCSICLNTFSFGDTVSTLPCNKRHMFHTYCLEKWFYNTVSCPLCRSNFSDKLEELVPRSNNRNNINQNIPMQDMNNNPFGGNNNNV